MFYLRNTEGVNRLGITVSKRVGKSVARHRIKRLYTEAFRSMQLLLTCSSYDFVIIARKEAHGLTYQQALKDLKELCKRGKFL